MSTIQRFQFPWLPLPILGATLLFVFSFTIPATAAVDCSSTITDPNSPLTDDYESIYSTLPCIKLTNGADLDLNGHSITNTTYGSESIAAIQCTSAGSEVTNSASTDAVISGNYVTGVWDCETVTDITINGTTFEQTPDQGVETAIKNQTIKASTITGNVINGPFAGIDATLFDKDSVIRNNYMKTFLYGIRVRGTTDGSGPVVEWNVIRKAGVSCLEKTGTDKVRIRKNVCTERLDLFLGTCLDIVATGTTLTDNTCDCTDQSEDCGLEPPADFPLL